MAKKLVIVESPAKARTISGILGSDFDVQASIGHIRDLLPNAKGLSDENRKKWWADYSVDVDNNFEPIYEVPAEKKQQVDRLKKALKGKDTLVLATDEDREGESISWHLLQVLKPTKDVKVERIAFHEITKEAILRALKEPRDVDMKLVEAQETRRILDRLYGYTLSPVLWSRVTRNLSAGRVQSPAVKLIVEREEQRRRFLTANYWGLKAELASDGQGFTAEMRQVAGRKIASGADFDDTTGELRTNARDVMLLDEKRAKAMEEGARVAKPWKIEKVTTREAFERPAPPFMTTTLQQDANRKFGFSADRTMRIAQTLYEGVSLGGDPVGLITYMRTDSLTLSTEAVNGIRDMVRREYPDCLPEKPEKYSSKVRNAQEAHEAIRPTDAERKPAQVSRYLSEDQNKLYDLIWKRTVACQMKPAQVLKTEAQITVDVNGEKLLFESSGKQILFDGFRRIYLEGVDDPDSERDAMERRLPRLIEGMEVEQRSVEAQPHNTKPPARYTDATLIKKLEEQGIGRPSTYASIISVIVDRGYVRKAGKQLIPSWMAYLTMEVLEKNFEEFVDLGFTAQMDDMLDEISEGRVKSRQYLHDFFMGQDGKPGLKTIVDERKKLIPYPAFIVGKHPESGIEIFVRTNKSGDPFLQLGPAEDKKFGNIPDDLTPAELTVAKALELFDARLEGPESIGDDPITGRRLLLRNRGGFYLELERTPEEIEAKEKPTWVSLPPNSDPRALKPEDIVFLRSLPKEVGKNPDTGDMILFKLGKYGAYVESGVERRTVENWRDGETINVEAAVALLAQPKFKSARSSTPTTIAEFGPLDGAAGPVKILSGRYGPYVTDGETNATLPRGTDPSTVTAEIANDLLVKKREAGPSKRPFKRRGATKAKPKATTSKTKTKTKATTTRAKKKA
jgi:DNA topoisomerase-1